MEGVPHDPRVPMLQEIVSALQEQVRQLKEDNARLREENERLRRRVEELTAAPRPPSPPPPPFAKPAAPPGRRRSPGRPAGHEASLRPPPRKVDRTVEVPLPAGGPGERLCPRCGTGLLTRLRRHRRLVEDLVPARVQVTRYRTASGYCPRCRRRVESRHPDQPPPGFHGDPPHAHAQLGVNALAAAAALRVEHRLPFRQVSAVLRGLSGLRVCAGALARQLQRLARWLAGERERIKLAVRAAPAVNADETGWRTGGRNTWLWAVGTPRHALYHADKSRGGAVIRTLLGGAFGGTLGCDFYGAYDALGCPKQRCLAHLRRELRDAAADNPAFAAGAFRRKCRRLLNDMAALKRRWDGLGDAAYTRKAVRLEDRLAALARARWGEADSDRLAARLLRYRDEVTAFLWRKDLDPTNNAAERDLRPAVVMRKITGGSRSDAGADAWATVASVLRTARKQGRDVIQTLKTLMVRQWAGAPPGILAKP